MYFYKNVFFHTKMYILNEKFKDKTNFVRNLELEGSGNDVLTKKYLKKGMLRHNPSSIQE